MPAEKITFPSKKEGLGTQGQAGLGVVGRVRGKARGGSEGLARGRCEIRDRDRDRVRVRVRGK